MMEYGLKGNKYKTICAEENQRKTKSKYQRLFQTSGNKDNEKRQNMIDKRHLQLTSHRSNQSQRKDFGGW